MVKQRIIDRFSDEDFRSIVESSFSYAEMSIKLGYKPYSGSIYPIKARIKSLGIDWEKDATKNPIRIPDSEFYVKGVYRQSIRERTLKDAFMPYTCKVCGNTGEWHGNKLSLQLDHVDGDATNNEKENLRWLCPNCHTQTSNYGAKNKKSYRKNKVRSTRPHKCPVCTKEFLESYRGQQTCSKKCSGLKKRKELPVKKQELYLKLKASSFTAVSKEYGVSDNAVRKWCKRYGLPTDAKSYKGTEM